jgi:hypothetical protein
MKNIPIILMALLGRTALSVDITFDSAKECTGHPLYGSKSLSSVSCYDISKLGKAQSAVMANFGNNEQVNFFADAMCQESLGSASTSSCYSPDGLIGSFEVSSSGNKVATSDLATSDVLLSNYTELAISSPGTIDSTASNLVIATGLFAIGGAYHIWDAYDSCHQAGEEKTVKSIVSCVGGPIASVATAAGGVFLGLSGEAIRGWYRGINGEINNVRKRDSIDDYNFEYMAMLMNVSNFDGHNGTHIGSMVRDMGSVEQTSPLYEIDMGEGEKWHMSAHLDEDTGEFVHHMRRAEDNAIELSKRKAPFPYDSIRWNKGGLDFIFCRHNRDAKLSGYKGVSRAKMFNIIWDQLTCQHNPTDFKSATHVKIDMHNEELVLVGSLYIKPYKTTHVSLPACGNNIPLALNQDCIIA